MTPKDSGKRPVSATELRRSMFGLDRRTDRVLSPCVNQTVEDVEQYYRNAQIGALAAVRNTQYGILQYFVSEIENRNPRNGRVYIPYPATWGGTAFYMKSGTNCYAPHGQTRLVVPTDEVLKRAAENPEGQTGVSTISEEGRWLGDGIRSLGLKREGS